MTGTFERLVGLVWMFIAAAGCIAQELLVGPKLDAPSGMLLLVDEDSPGHDDGELLWRLDRHYKFPDREAIVDFQVTVAVDGSVTELAVKGGFYDQTILDVAVREVRELKFSPATGNGQAVPWPAQDLRIIFRGVSITELGADESQARMYELSGESVPFVFEGATSIDIQRLSELANEGDNVAMEALATELLQSKVRTLSQYAEIQNYLASVYLVTGRLPEALVASREALADSLSGLALLTKGQRDRKRVENLPRAVYLPEQLELDALAKRFAIAALLRQPGEAVRTFSELEEAGTTESAKVMLDKLRPQLDQMLVELSSADPYSSAITLVGGSWIYLPSGRRKFGFSNVNGVVSIVDITCEGNIKRRLLFQPEIELGIPDSWENCSLKFHGEEGAQFLLHEYSS